MSGYRVDALAGSSDWQHGPSGSWNTQYDLTVTGPEGTIAVQHNRKQGSPMPTIGEVIEGYLEHGNSGYPPKLKRAQQQQGAPPQQAPGPQAMAPFVQPPQTAPQAPPVSGPPPSSGAQGPALYDDPRQRAITRQHSQEMALRWLSVRGGEAAPMLKDLWELVNHFDLDVRRAALDIDGDIPF